MHPLHFGCAATIFFCLAGNSLAANLVVNRFSDRTEMLLDAGLFHVTSAAVSNETLIAIPNSAVHIVVWDEGTIPTATACYAISLDGVNVDSVRRTSYEIKLKFAEFDPLVATPTISSGLASDAGTQMYLVQFKTQPLQIFHQRITALEGVISDFLSNHTYIVAMSQATKNQVADLPYVRWVGPYHPAYRLEPFLSSALTENSLPPSQQRYNILTHQEGWAQKLVVADQIETLGGAINRLTPGGRSMEASLTPTQLREVVRMEEVAYVDRWGPPQTTMDNARKVSGANYLLQQNSQFPFDGTGVIGEVLDSSVVPDNHAAFNLNRIPHGEQRMTGIQSHGTFVFGSVFGNGLDAPVAGARGMMPGAQGVFADYCRMSEHACQDEPDCECVLGELIEETVDRYCHTCELVSSDCCSYCCTECPCPASEYMPHPSLDAVFQTNSWGTLPPSTTYTAVTREIDASAATFDILMCQAQANWGGQDSAPQAWAKNVVSVGGFFHSDNFDYLDDRFVLGEASFGPASDGRVKPDLTNFYERVMTTRRNYDAQGHVQYTPDFGGTSAATPITCGSFGLFFQMWKEGVLNVCGRTGCGPSGGMGTVFEERPPMSLAKAMMINTARPFDFLVPEGDPAETNRSLTREKQGWGLPMIGKVLALARRNAFLKIIDETEVLTELKKDTYTITVPSQAQALRVTLVYTDPACSPATLSCAGNDLSVRAFYHANVAHDYWGNNGLMDDIWSAPEGEPSHVDNVENIFVPDPPAGTWTVEVHAQEIRVDGHPETAGILDADYSLVVSVDHDCNGDFIADSEQIADGRLPDCNQNGVPDLCDIIAGSSIDCDANTIPDECPCPNCPCPLGLISTTVPASPPHLTRDARQPHPMNDNSLDARQGIGSVTEPITITMMNSLCGNVGPQCFGLCETGIEQTDGTPLDGVALAANQIVSVTKRPSPENAYDIVLARPISAGHWSVIKYWSGSKRIIYSSLPGDVNIDGVSRSSSPSDVDYLTACIGTPGLCPTVFRRDIDRSGSFPSGDVLRLADLLGGSDTFIEWEGKMLPNNVCAQSGGGGPYCPDANCGGGTDPQAMSMSFGLVGFGEFESLDNSLTEVELTPNQEHANALAELLTTSNPTTAAEFDFFETSVVTLTQFAVANFSSEEKAILANWLVDPMREYASAIAQDRASEVVQALVP